MEQLKKKYVLLVDDEILISMGTKAKLEKYDYKILLASSGEQVFEYLATRDDIILILMDIDLGCGSNGIELSRQILQERDIPIVFVSSHTEPEVVSLTEYVTSYGYIVKSSSITAYDASIKMAHKLFIEKKRTLTFDRYLKVALENASEPIFISDTAGDVIFCNKAYLRITGMDDSTNYTKEIARYSAFVKIFSDKGELLSPDDWASTRGLKGKSSENEVFFVYNQKLAELQVNRYTYAPIYDERQTIIGSYVKIGLPVQHPDPEVLKAIRATLGAI